ncbi:hypothetical protein BV898_04003 [Hypsibius exemplaris]|uniref:Uncharacterized protein n=1 Tax=Hypsibius exemplaris TaxID=2072580 RepID=A0A1W0X3M8_HYPEX|nr:hypothetical protein BV898_04003 [Hypsibius exemplaris]
MERAKNLERTDVSGEVGVNGGLKNLSMEDDDGRKEEGDEDVLDSEEEEDELPENMIMSFSTTGTDDESLQREYDMLSSSSMNDFSEMLQEDGVNDGDIIAGTGLDGEVLNGVYFDKLELELNAIEQAMGQFEGRLDLLREQAQDLLLTLQSERLTAAATDDLVSPSDASTGPVAALQGGGDDS